MMKLEQVMKLERDMVNAVVSLTDREARYLVDAYYQMQEKRKASANQIRALNASEEPHEIIDWYFVQTEAMETQIERALDRYTLAYPAGRWMRQQLGVGPVLAANFLAHLSVEPWHCTHDKNKCAPDKPHKAKRGEEKCERRLVQTAGGFWRFAGLDPTIEWKKGELRPFNAKLKVACWKLGDSFVKLGEGRDSLYAKIYREEKARRVAANERGDYKEKAAEQLKKYNYGKTTEAYKAVKVGRLPDQQIDLQARRKAVKMFLSHLHHVMWEDRFDSPPPVPFAMAMGHAHYIAPPGWPLEEGTTETKRERPKVKRANGQAKR